jgi:hypothetical protein
MNKYLVHMYYMLLVYLPIWLVVVVALTLSGCTAIHANPSTHQDQFIGQNNSARLSSQPASKGEPTSAPTAIAPPESQDLTQNPVSDASSINSSTSYSSVASGHSDAIDNSSANQEDPRIALAQHLTSIGAKIYTTDWCSTCKRQKRDFGEAAFALLTMINCEEKPDLCADAGVHRYPTWEINGQKYERGFPLNELAQLSNYSGPALPTP